MKKIIYMLILLVAGTSSCNNEYLNPSAADQDALLKDASGVGFVSLANALQYRFSVGQNSPCYSVPATSLLLAKQMNVLNAGNTGEQQLMQGGHGLLGNNSVLTNIWNESQVIRSNADMILNHLSAVVDQGMKGALHAHAAVFKAMALGNLALFWENAPVATKTNAPFVSRVEVLKIAISTLEAASAEFKKAAPSDVFKAKIAGGIDYANTINALIARYAMMAGDYDKALDAARKVSLDKAVKSFFSYDDLTRNALFVSAFSNRNLIEPIDTSFGLPKELQPASSDKRIAFFFTLSGGVAGKKNRAFGSFYNSNSSPVPLYRGGEVTLLKAEAYVRKASPDLNAAVAELNEVLTKKPDKDAWGIGGDLPAYSGGMTAQEILAEIFRQRTIELYIGGMQLEDSRRFNRPESERGRNFLPYPFSERDNNINTPPDPIF